MPHCEHNGCETGTSLEVNLKHITVTLATWDAVWEVYLGPRWVRQRLRLYRAQDRALEQFFKKARLEKEMAELSKKRHGRAKQLVVCFGAAGIGTGGGWGADVVLRGLLQDAKRNKRTKAEQAAELTQPTNSKGKSKGQGCQSQTSTTARQVAGQGLQRSAELPAHRGEQVAPTGAVLVAKADSSTSPGQGVP
ncbi:hypothetical protein QJQ45_006487 [Haematococcus lacustris]|nr:hypothetical protein QJQ45_006487 [Haematococcus lacustris]